MGHGQGLWFKYNINQVHQKHHKLPFCFTVYYSQEKKQGVVIRGSFQHVFLFYFLPHKQSLKATIFSSQTQQNHNEIQNKDDIELEPHRGC